MRKILNSLISPTKGGTEAMSQLGISIKDSHGQMKPFNEIMQDFHDKMQGLSKTQKIDILHQIFGTTGQAAAAILTNSSKSLSDFNEEVKHANKNDYVGKLSKKNMDNPVNQIKRLKASFKQLEMSMAGAFSKNATSGIKTVTDLINKMNDASPATQDLFKKVAIGIPVLAGGLTVLGSIIRNIKTISSTFNGFNASFDSKTRKQTRLIKEQIDALIAEDEEYQRLTRHTQEGSVGVSNIYSKGGTSGLSSAEKSVSKSAKGASSLSKTANTFEEGSKSLKFVKGAGRLVGGGIGALDVINAGSDLIGMKKNTVGQSVGGATGTLLGAGVGSFAGPIGTAVGGAVGEQLGKYVGKTVQHNSETQSKQEKQEKYNSSYHTGLKGDSNKSYSNMAYVGNLEDQLSKLKKPIEKSFNSKPEYDKALKLYETKRKDLLDKIKGLYGSEEDLLDDHQKNEEEKHKSGAKTLQKDLGLSDAQLQDIQNGHYERQKEQLQNDINERVKLLKNGGKGHKEELKQLNKDIANILGNGSTKTSSILNALVKSNKQISDKDAGNRISASHEAMVQEQKNAQTKKDNANSDAKQQHENDLWWLENARQTGQIRGKQYTDEKKKIDDKWRHAKDKAQDEYDAVVGSAEDEYNDTIGWARKKTKDHLASVDEESGRVIGEANKQAKAWDKARKAEENYHIQHTSSLKYRKNNKDTGFWGGVGNFIHNMSVESNRGYYKSKKDEEYGKKRGMPVKPTWSTGGKIAYNQEALVNEKGMESAYNPKNNTIRFFEHGPQIAKLNKGEYILNASDTHKLTHGGLGKGKTLNGYKDGTASLSGSKGITVSLKNIKSLDNFKDKSHDIWQYIKDDTHDKVSLIHDDTTKSLSDMKKNVLGTFKDLDNGIYNETKKTVSGYDKAFSNLPNLTHKNMSQSINELNKGYSSINHSLNQFGSNDNVLKPIHYATGSNGAVTKEHMAIVNDAKKGNEQEAIVRDNGVFLPKHKDALVNLKKGDAVLNGAQTKQFVSGIGLSHYKSGTGVSDNKLKELIENNYKNSGKALKNDFTDQSNMTKGSDIAKAINKNNQNGLSNDMNNWYHSIWKTLNEATGEGGSANAFLKYAKENYSGDKYQLGANGPDLFDCSSMIEDALKHFGIQLGRTTTAMQSSSKLQRLGNDISKAKAGDLALFGHGDGANGHVGIVNNPSQGTMFNETPPSAGVTRISDVTSVPLDGYYRIKGLSDSDEKHSSLDKFTKKQLGKKRLDWVQKHLGDQSFDGPIPTGDHAELLKKAGIPEKEWSAYDYIISRESGWNAHARNPDGGAYGLPQSLPANKMASAGSDWHDNPVTQLKWMSKYVEKYGGINGAQKYWAQHHNYENGGLVDHDQMARIGEKNKPEMVLPLTNKMRSMRLIQQALSYMNGHEASGGHQDNKKIEKLEKDIDKLSKNNSKMVELLGVIADKVGNPTRAIVSEKDLINSINKHSQRERRNSAMRRGENFV